MLGVGGGDGDQERIGGGQVESTRAVGLVAGGGDDGDAAAPQLLGGVGERLAHVGAARVHAEREVQHADPQAVGVPVAAHPVERHEHADEAGDAVGAGDLDADEPGPGRDALVAGLGIGGGDDARHVRAVAERVEAAQVGVERVLGEVGAAHELARAVERRDAEHAGVDQGDVDAGAGEALGDAGGGADQVGRGASAGRAVVGGGLDGRDGVDHRVLAGGDRVLAARHGIGLEGGAGRGVLRGVRDRLARRLVGRHVGGDLVRRGVDRRGRRVLVLRAGAGVAGRRLDVEVDRVGRRQRQPDVTRDAADGGRAAQAADRAGRDAGREAVDDREPVADPSAEAHDEPLGGALAARLGADHDEHPGRLRVRRFGAEQPEHERKHQERTDGRADHARHIGRLPRKL